MKNLSILIFLFFNNFIFAQCFIQYSYDSSGNRIKREYVGGCARTVLKQDEYQLNADTLLMNSNETRTEIIRKDLEAQISVYPNPTDGQLNVKLDRIEKGWAYKLTSISGYVIQQSLIESQEVFIDIGDKPVASYIFSIYDSSGFIIYYTNIIKI